MVTGPIRGCIVEELLLLIFFLKVHESSLSARAIAHLWFVCFLCLLWVVIVCFLPIGVSIVFGGWFFFMVLFVVGGFTFVGCQPLIATIDVVLVGNLYLYLVHLVVAECLSCDKFSWKVESLSICVVNFYKEK